MGEPEVIRGERVRLRQMVRSDVDAMAHWPRFREPELGWANLELSHPADRDLYFDRGRTNPTRRRYVILNENDDIVGTVGLRNLDFKAGEGTLGIIMRADVVGNGYGTDAIQTIIRFAFECLRFQRVLLDVAVNNHRARHVYDKLGFVRVGQHVGPHGVVYVDMVLERPSFEEHENAWAPTRSSPVH